MKLKVTVNQTEYEIDVEVEKEVPSLPPIVIGGSGGAPVAAPAPSAAGAAGANDPAWFKSAVRSGKYVKGVAAAHEGEKDKATCTLTATFKAASAGVNDKVAGNTISMKLTPATGAWECETNLADNVAPAACRGATKK